MQPLQANWKVTVKSCYNSNSILIAILKESTLGQWFICEACKVGVGGRGLSTRRHDCDSLTTCFNYLIDVTSTGSLLSVSITG